MSIGATTWRASGLAQASQVLGGAEARCVSTPQDSRCAQGRPRLLVCGRDPSLVAFLESELGAAFVVAPAAFGARFLGIVRSFHPDVAVVDLALGGQAAGVMISILKDESPDARIVAVSASSSPEDGEVLEQGIYYYAPDGTGPRLLEVIAAAGRGRGRDASRQIGQVGSAHG